MATQRPPNTPRSPQTPRAATTVARSSPAPTAPQPKPEAHAAERDNKDEKVEREEQDKHVERGEKGKRDEDSHWTDLYQQVCTSYHAIEDMRIKLLSFLPLSSGAGIFLLLTTPGAPTATASAIHSFLTPIGAVGALITVGLFAYELRATQNSIALTTAGKQLERNIGTAGAFTALPHSFGYIINYLFAAVLIYSAVFAGWVYVAVSPWANAGHALVAAIVSYAVPVILAILIQFVLKWALRDQIEAWLPLYPIPNQTEWLKNPDEIIQKLEKQAGASLEHASQHDLPDAGAARLHKRHAAQATRLIKKLERKASGGPVLFTSDEVTMLAAEKEVTRDDLLVGLPPRG